MDEDIQVEVQIGRMTTTLELHGSVGVNEVLSDALGSPQVELEGVRIVNDDPLTLEVAFLLGKVANYATLKIRTVVQAD